MRVIQGGSSSLMENRCGMAVARRRAIIKDDSRRRPQSFRCERQPLRSIHMESWHSPLMAGVRFPALQALNFRSAQMPELPGLEAAVCEEGKPHSLELDHTLPRTLKHSPHLVVSAFHERDFIPGLIALGNHANL